MLNNHSKQNVLFITSYTFEKHDKKNMNMFLSKIIPINEGFFDFTMFVCVRVFRQE